MSKKLRRIRGGLDPHTGQHNVEFRGDLLLRDIYYSEFISYIAIELYNYIVNFYRVATALVRARVSDCGHLLHASKKLLQHIAALTTRFPYS